MIPMMPSESMKPAFGKSKKKAPKKKTAKDQALAIKKEKC